jgi:alpha-L-fucosidase
MRTMAFGLLLFGVAMAIGVELCAEETKPAASAVLPKPYLQRLQWWGEGRFGMFIHWGPVSLKETEISWSRANSNPKCPNAGTISVAEYDDLYKRFNPTEFNANEWVAIAKAAGMKYMVLTAKHCDGFLLWDSKGSKYNIMHTPFKRDVCAELAKACHEQGMRIGWYYSPMDWRDPDCRVNDERFAKTIREELRELLTNYGKIDLLWFDTDGYSAPWGQKETYAMIKELQPEIVINNRFDLMNPGSASAHTPESIGPNADYYTPEQFIGGFDVQHPWESCMTTSRINQWSWGGKNDGVKPFSQILDMVVGCAGGDGNVLLNVGPTPAGIIAPEQADLIKQMGPWMEKNGESIYGTRGGPFKPGVYGVSTRKGKTIYVHVRKWLEDTVHLPAISAKVVGSRVLGGGTVGVQQTESGIDITVPESDRQPLDTIVALDVDVDTNEIPAVDVPRPTPVSEKAKATASNVFQNQAEYAAEKAVDGKPDTRWATDAGLKNAWLELDLGQPVTFKRALISEAFPNRVQKFELQWLDGTEWKTFDSGTTIGESWSHSFSPVTAQKVRFNVLESTDGPTIWEFQLYK